MSPGTGVIKHYQIVSCLGQGGFGKVFEAWDSKLQRSVAIKCLTADGLLSPAADLIREARMAASLNHVAFVKIHALEDDDNSQAIVMELVKGETLKHLLGNSKPDQNQVIHIIRQIADAMQQAHAIGLTHGDLKPSNLIITWCSYFLAIFISKGVLPTSTSSINTEADDGLLENFTNCFEPETIVAQLVNKNEIENNEMIIDFFIEKCIKN